MISTPLAASRLKQTHVVYLIVLLVLRNLLTHASLARFATSGGAKATSIIRGCRFNVLRSAK